MAIFGKKGNINIFLLMKIVFKYLKDIYIKKNRLFFKLKYMKAYFYDMRSILFLLIYYVYHRYKAHEKGCIHLAFP